MVWKSIVLTLCLRFAWSRDRQACTYFFSNGMTSTLVHKIYMKNGGKKIQDEIVKEDLDAVVDMFEKETFSQVSLRDIVLLFNLYDKYFLPLTVFIPVISRQTK